MSSLATAHNTWTNELADTQNTATINNSIAANPSSVTDFNPSTYTIPGSVMQVVLAWCPLFTEELLMQQVQGFTSANAQTLITGGIGPQLQSMLQGLEALITQAGSGDVLLRRYGRDSRARFQTAEYRSGSGGAHFELAKFGAMWGFAGGLLAVAGAVAMATGVGELVLCAFGAYEITVSVALAATAGFCGIMGGVDDEMGW